MAIQMLKHFGHKAQVNLGHMTSVSGQLNHLSCAESEKQIFSSSLCFPRGEPLIRVDIYKMVAELVEYPNMSIRL